MLGIPPIILYNNGYSQYSVNKFIHSYIYAGFYISLCICNAYIVPYKATIMSVFMRIY